MFLSKTSLADNCLKFCNRIHSLSELPYRTDRQSNLKGHFAYKIYRELLPDAGLLLQILCDGDPLKKINGQS